VINTWYGRQGVLQTRGRIEVQPIRPRQRSGARAGLSPVAVRVRGYPETAVSRWTVQPFVRLRSPYGFTPLLQRAQTLAGELRTVTNALNTFTERAEAGFLDMRRADHEQQILELTLDIRRQQWREAECAAPQRSPKASGKCSASSPIRSSDSPATS
jgi:hypothetical protein